MAPGNLAFATPGEALSWLTLVREGKVATPSDFNWHGFAESAAQKARHDARSNASDNADIWASIAVSVYATLAKESMDGFSYEYSAMNLRAWFIRRLGTRPGHTIRDSADLYRWFFDGQTMSIEQATNAATELRATPMDRWNEQIYLVRSLRRIKESLSVLRLLAESDLTPEIQRWLDICHLLP